MGSGLRRALPTSPSPASSSTVTGNTKNEPTAILSTWTALEALSPATYTAPHDLVYGDRNRVVRFEDGPLPWTTSTKPPPGKQVFYSVILGSMLMDPATEALIRVGDRKPRCLRNLAFPHRCARDGSFFREQTGSSTHVKP